MSPNKQTPRRQHQIAGVYYTETTSQLLNVISTKHASVKYQILKGPPIVET